MLFSVIMGDSDVAGALTRRRRATFAARRGATLLPMNGRSAAGCQGSGTADASGDDVHGKRDRSLEPARSKSKSVKQKRRNDISDRLR